jgi:hypothetical protein
VWEEKSQNAKGAKEFAKYAKIGNRVSEKLRLRFLKSRLNDHAALACFRVLLAFFAALLREAADRLRAAVRACLDSAEWEAAERPFFLRAFEVARERLAEGLRAEWLCPFR